VHSLLGRYARTSLRALLCAAAVLAAGCHHNNQNSGYGIGWVSLTDTSGDFASYIVNVDSVTLTGAVNGVVTAVATPETVDFTKLKDISELWSAASIPNDTYTSATIVVDYTTANVSVNVNGFPVKAKVVDIGAVIATTQTINIRLDASHPLVIVPTYAATDAQRLAINFDLAASNIVSLATATPVVTIKPFMTIATSASDRKPIRIRGPLINSSLGEGTYTVYVRPFFDEVNSLGQLSIFSTPDTVYTLSGTTYVGAPGLTALSHFSAGTTMTAAYASFKPTLTPTAVAGIFTSTFVVGGSTLEDFYTQGLEGDVIARKGNTLTLRGSTLQLNDGTSQYNDVDSLVLLGPATIVTAEDNTTLKGLDYNSVSVGQHIIARGIYSLSATSVVTLDATGSSSTNTGSVRLLSTQVYGSLISSGTGSLVLDVLGFENWPINAYDFAGTGAVPALSANYLVSTGSAALPSGLAVGDLLWINGIVAPFGAAPPDFEAFTINTEISVPATLEAVWDDAGSARPFSTLTSTGLSIDLTDAALTSALIRVGSERIDMKTSGISPLIVPVATPAATPGLPDLFLPLFAIGNVVDSTPTVTSVVVYNSFASFAAQLPKSLAAGTPAHHFTASGTYNRTGNAFTATNIDVVD
jgi:hypothetical protein